jgi:trehalose 6-phosphate phosphatase
MLAMASPPARLDAARARAIEAAAAIPGMLVEDKRDAIALHYRAAPSAEAAVRRAAIDVLDLAGPFYELMHGKYVIELKPKNTDKGIALAALMNTTPFAGRAPWMIGDDFTDEDAFIEANERDGVSVIVGTRRPTEARHALEDPAAARRWLAALAAGSVAEIER